MHKEVSTIVLCLLYCLCSIPSIAQNRLSLTTQLDSLSKQLDAEPYTTGISVWDLTADSAVYSYNAHKVLRPASTQKLITAITALDVLGAQHEYKTQAFYEGTLTSDSVLNGNITIVGDYDPMLTFDDVHDIACNFFALGIKAINGKIIGSSTMAAQPMFGKGWCWDDIPGGSAPYLSPLMFDRGRLSPQSRAFSRDMYFDPSQWFVHTVDSLLQSMGIRHTDASITPPEGAPRYCFYTCTHTINDVLQDMMKKSDNLYAESMFRQLSSTSQPVPQLGPQLNTQPSSQPGTQLSPQLNSQLVDGSGLSLYNYLTPDTETAYLRYAYSQQHIFQYLYPALPIAGVDGSLKSRMQTGKSYNNVHAKTGTLTGVSSLAGYVTSADGHLLAFSIIINGVLTGSTGRAMQDRICEILAGGEK